MTFPARHPVAPALVAALAAVCLTTCAGPAGLAGPAPARGPARTRVFPVLDHGGLEVAVPAGWDVRTIEGEPGMPASVRLVPPDGGTLFLSPLWNADSPDEGSGTDSARFFAELARRKALGSSTEADLPIHDLVGEDGAVRGHWFVATDRDYVPPEPGKVRWRNMLRGASAVGRLLVSFTWFDDAPGPSRDAVLALVRDARHVGDPAAEPPKTPDPLRFAPDPGVATAPLAVEAPGGAFTVLVDLPGFEMYAPRPAPDGGGVLVLGQHPGTGLVASVTIRAAGGSPDARACRDRRVQALRRAAPDLADLRTSEVGAAARASYVLRELRGREIRQDHAHTFLAREGLCVDVLVSKADPEPADAKRIEAVLASVRFAERL